MRLKDKVAIVTGSSRGLGKALAAALAAEGADVAVTARSLPAAEGAAAEIGPLAFPLALDVTSEARSWAEDPARRYCRKPGQPHEIRSAPRRWLRTWTSINGETISRTVPWRWPS